jgi:hypothetical protein
LPYSLENPTLGTTVAKNKTIRNWRNGFFISQEQHKAGKRNTAAFL